MKVKVVGKTHPIHRVITGLHSFDYAFENKAGDIGFPMRGIVELSGTTGCGKTTLVLGLASLIGKIEKKDIIFADIEGYDPNMMETVVSNTGFDGSIYLINETTDEEALDEMISQVEDNDERSIAIFDSIGAVSPIAELKGSLGEANMGRRAKLLSAFSRKVIHLNNKKPNKTFIMINHQHPVIGGRGLTTPGGETIKYISPIRIRVKRSDEWDDGSYVLEGKVIKNRYGFDDRIFHVFIAAGWGISPLMTAVYECRRADILGGNWRGVKLDGQSFGNYSSILDKALKNDVEFFQPFMKALSNVVPLPETEDNGEPSDDSETDTE